MKLFDPMDVDRRLTRRALLGGLATGFGSLALGSLLDAEARAATTPVGPHFAPRAKSVIYIMLVGGASQIDLFDPKPVLVERDGELCPDELFVGKRLAFIRERPKILGTRFEFRAHGQSGIEVSELLPRFARMVDETTLIRSMTTDEFNHTPAELQLLTGIGRFGRPSIGSWVAYGLGSDNRDLPAFVVLISTPQQPAGGSASWGAGFLPARHQGVEFRGTGEPILFLDNPPGVSRKEQRVEIDAISELNRMEFERHHDPLIEARIAQYEMAYRMQMSVPDAVDIWSESAGVHDLYGTTPGKLSFSNQCLLARRLVERGVRFVQIFDVGWDHHSGIFGYLPDKCRQIDQGIGALLTDLKQRGLLDETLVVFATEFGRTPVVQDTSEFGFKGLIGRDHQRDAFSVWLAGAGVKSGFVYGRTSELGHEVVENPVHVHDLNATILHLLGIDHKRLTYRSMGRDFRLTDVAGNVVDTILT